MTPTRRKFLKTAGALGAGLAVGGTAACVPDARPGPRASNPPAPKRLLLVLESPFTSSRAASGFYPRCFPTRPAFRF